MQIDDLVEIIVRVVVESYCLFGFLLTSSVPHPVLLG